MSYLNEQTGYREDLLATRSVVKKENYVLIEPDGIVKNAIPGYVNCDVTILGSPELGASFVDYLV
ncbi:MAG: (S)-ureidoglycine aminohydrolase, partial [Lachnospiraceae bacterium]